MAFMIDVGKNKIPDVVVGQITFHSRKEFEQAVLNVIGRLDGIWGVLTDYNTNEFNRDANGHPIEAQ